MAIAYPWETYLLPVQQEERVRLFVKASTPSPRARQRRDLGPPVERTVIVPVAVLHYTYLSDQGTVTVRYPSRKERRAMWRRGEPSPVRS